MTKRSVVALVTRCTLSLGGSMAWFCLALVCMLLGTSTPGIAQQHDQKITLSQGFLAAKQATNAGFPSFLDDPDLRMPAATSYDVIALRVSFQPDTSRFTTGNGTFDGPLFDSLEARVDPLPHDAAYFEAHLQFLENYIERVSDGGTRLRTHLLPEVIQLSGKMEEYSPIGLEAGSDEELGKLANLVEEAWTEADQNATLDVAGFDPATTAFVIFHAGVGRDIELVGTTLDITPQDIPTIFFNEESLDRLSGIPLAFKGIPVNHTILLPRTESRQGFDFIQDAPFLIEFSINGLMAASFLNYLGVPDLFNTETGESAIGPFGLMDPLGLFAYNGLFPPEPSAWTKQYLGWNSLSAITENAPGTYSLDAVGNAGGPPDVALIQVSSAEYFLLENRYRDLNGDGLVLTVFRNGALEQQRYENGQEDFNAINIDAFQGGVVVDVDDYDWALPGGIDEDGNALLGGMLIWHIDERVLVDGLPLNRVNVDPERRAIDLEEADSAQDLGFPRDNILGPQPHLGTPFDFYFEGNPVLAITSTGERISLYENRFGPTTIPNSDTNGGGSSFVVVGDFSLPGPRMSFSFMQTESGGLRVVEEFRSPGSRTVPDGSYVTALADPRNGVAVRTLESELTIASAGNPGTLEIVSTEEIGLPVVLPDGRLIALTRTQEEGLGLNVFEDGAFLRTRLSVLVGDDTGVIERSGMLYNATEDRVYVNVSSVSFAGVLEVDISTDVTIVQQLRIPGDRMHAMAATDEGDVGILTDDGVFWQTGRPAWAIDIDVSEQVGQLVLGADRTGTVGAFPLLSTNELVFLQADGGVQRIDIERFADSASSISSYPVLVDLNGDDQLDALIAYGNQLIAVSSGGALVAGFPLDIPAEIGTQPLVAQLSESGGWSVVLGAVDGNLYAFDLGAGGRSIPGFPISVDFNINATPLLDGNRMYVASSDAELRVWEFDMLGEVWWGKQHANRENTSFVRLPLEEPGNSGSGLLGNEEVYNWPNPIRNGQTFFRLTPSTDVDLTITVIDAAGNLIDRLDVGRVRGATPADIEWRTEAASGLYYARIEVRDDNGQNETTLLKMAVIR